MTTKGNTSEALQFLKAWSEECPWVLTSIVPDGGRTQTVNFRLSDPEHRTDGSEERAVLERIRAKKLRGIYARLR